MSTSAWRGTIAIHLEGPYVVVLWNSWESNWDDGEHEMGEKSEIVSKQRE